MSRLTGTTNQRLLMTCMQQRHVVSAALTQFVIQDANILPSVLTPGANQQ